MDTPLATLRREKFSSVHFYYYGERFIRTLIHVPIKPHAQAHGQGVELATRRESADCNSREARAYGTLGSARQRPRLGSTGASVFCGVGWGMCVYV